MDKSTLYARRCGQLPDIFWYQLNGKSAQENFQDQMNAQKLKRKSAETVKIVFSTNVRIKK